MATSLLSNLKNAYHLLKDIDFDTLAKLSAKVDLPAVRAMWCAVHYR